MKSKINRIFFLHHILHNYQSKAIQLLLKIPKKNTSNFYILLEIHLPFAFKFVMRATFIQF